jgi:sulfate adenylyltransferase
MARQLTARMIATDGFRSHQVTAEDIEWADVVLTMEESHRMFLLDDHPTALTKMFTLGHFATRATGDLHGSELLADLARHRGRALRSEDVRDPYSLGDEAAALAADRIAGLVDITITALG